MKVGDSELLKVNKIFHGQFGGHFISMNEDFLMDFFATSKAL